MSDSKRPEDIWRALSRAAQVSVLGRDKRGHSPSELEEHELVEPGPRPPELATHELKWLPLADEVRESGSLTTWYSYHDLREQFCYFLECQMATIEGLRGVRRTSKSELRRHENILEKMLVEAARHRVTLEDARRWRCPRLVERLETTEHLVRRTPPGEGA